MKQLFNGQKRKAIGIICFMIAFLFPIDLAFSHKVYIYAWVEDNTVFTENYMSGKKPVKSGQITAYDLDGNILVEGKTDEKGKFSFKVLKKSGMKIVLEAGTGHRAQWIVPIEEINGKLSPDSNEMENHPSMGEKITGNLNSEFFRNTTPDELQMMIEKALDKKLNPVIEQVNKSLQQNQDPRMQDIIGGIGYILGLVGVGMYFNYRKQKNNRQ